jgi:signal transduction histidine kinase/CheY-like chemotaxis protein
LLRTHCRCRSRQNSKGQLSHPPHRGTRAREKKPSPEEMSSQSSAGGSDEDRDEIALLRATALQNVEVVQRARARAEQELLKLKEKLEEESRVLEVLNRIGSALAAKRLDLEGIVTAVTEAATAITGAQFGAFFYTANDPDTGKVFQLYTLVGAPREAFERLGHPRSTPIFAPTFNGDRIVRSRDITADPDYGKWDPHRGMPVGHLPVRSYLAVPVVSPTGKVLGGLFFGHAETDVFTDRVERVVASIAIQAAMAIDNARLYEQARRSAEEREQLLTAEREARSAVERASLLKDQFLATLSHELRTPLNAILGWTELLLSRPSLETRKDTRPVLETIARNARVQAKLIEDLLDMNLIVSGRLRLAIEPVDLVSVIDASLDTIQHAADAKAITIRRMIDPSAGPVTGDANRLQQVVWNLLSNSVKFTEKGGKIDVLLQRVNSHLQIVVQDTGHGISAEFLPHVFERFRQEDASATRHFGGLGLGLSIVKQLIELHGGTIRVESGGIGKGTSFFVLLPVRAVPRQDEAGGFRKPSGAAQQQELLNSGAAAAHNNVKELEESALSLEGIRALVVDDQPDACALLKAVLEGASAPEVLTASSSAEALTLMKTHQFDIILSDIGMPDRDGNAFMRDVRALAAEEGGKTPAIAITAFARSEDRTRAMLAGYQVHLSKPIDAMELLATIRSLVKNR